MVAGSHDHAGRRDYRNRGKGIAGSRPSGRSLSGNAIVAPGAQLGAGAPLSWAIATARQVCWAADSEQAQSRFAWARTVPRYRRDLGHAVVAWPGVAVISSLPAHALLPIVRSGSETDVDGGGCSATRAVARCACRSRRIGSPASTSTTPATAAKHGRGPVARMPGVVGDAVGCASGEFVTSGRPRARPALVPARVLVGSLPGWLQLFDGSQPAATPVFVSVRCIA